MQCTFAHNNLNVLDLEKSLAFMRKGAGPARCAQKRNAGLHPVLSFRRHHAPQAELTWLRGREKPYDLGENEFHLAFAVSDMAEAHALHEAMGCICFENPENGHLFHCRPGRLLAGDSARRIRRAVRFLHINETHGGRILGGKPMTEKKPPRGAPALPVGGHKGA